MLFGDAKKSAAGSLCRDQVCLTVTPHRYEKQLIFVVYLLLLLAPSSAQNILLNPGFEDINNCTEYHMDCSPEAWYNIPAENILVNASYTPEPATGRNVLLVMLDNVTRPKKQVVYTLLGCPLQKDRMYDLVFFIYWKAPF